MSSPLLRLICRCGADNTVFGFSSSVWGRDTERCGKIADKLVNGMGKQLTLTRLKLQKLTPSGNFAVWINAWGSTVGGNLVGLLCIRVRLGRSLMAKIGGYDTTAYERREGEHRSVAFATHSTGGLRERIALWNRCGKFATRPGLLDVCPVVHTCGRQGPVTSCGYVKRAKLDGGLY